MRICEIHRMKFIQCDFHEFALYKLKTKASERLGVQMTAWGSTSMRVVYTRQHLRILRDKLWHHSLNRTFCCLWLVQNFENQKPCERLLNYELYLVGWLNWRALLTSLKTSVRFKFGTKFIRFKASLALWWKSRQAAWKFYQGNYLCRQSDAVWRWSFFTFKPVSSAPHKIRFSMNAFWYIVDLRIAIEHSLTTQGCKFKEPSILRKWISEKLFSFLMAVFWKTFVA